MFLAFRDALYVLRTERRASALVLKVLHQTPSNLSLVAGEVCATRPPFLHGASRVTRHVTSRPLSRLGAWLDVDTNSLLRFALSPLRARCNKTQNFSPFTKLLQET